MGFLRGLDEYLDEYYHLSVFDTALESGEPWEFHLHGRRILTLRVLQNEKYDLEVEGDDRQRITLPKLHVKCLYPASTGASAIAMIKTDRKVQEMGLEPIPAPMPALEKLLMFLLVRIEA